MAIASERTLPPPAGALATTQERREALDIQRVIPAPLRRIAWLLGTGAVSLFGFLAIVGGLSPADVPGMTVAVVGLAAARWIHGGRMSRYYHQNPHNSAERHEFERRGF